MQRHAQRFPTGANDDGENDANFAQKLSNFTSANKGNASALFTGPLSFLNTYTYEIQDTGLLTGIGASTEFLAGVTFWNRYGRSKCGLRIPLNPSRVRRGNTRPRSILFLTLVSLAGAYQLLPFNKRRVRWHCRFFLGRVLTEIFRNLQCLGCSIGIQCFFS